MGAPAWLAYATIYQDIELLPIDGNPSDERMLEGDEKVVLLADHLAALERGRVETLREARKHVSAAIDGYREAAPDAWAHISADVEQTFDAMRDRLIDAATTGGVIDMGFLSLPAEVQGELTDHAATTGDTDD